MSFPAGWFSLDADRPFLDDLATGALRALEPLGDEALADSTLLAPTRRAARGLAHALLKASPRRALVLPQIRVMGDLDEGEPPFQADDPALDLPPAISGQRRRFELAGLVAEHFGEGHRKDAGQALAFADALAAFLDACQIEEVDPTAKLDDLAGLELAEHWRVSADFLRIALEAWPARLAEIGLMDLAARRVALLRALARRWREAPPRTPVIAAGSTGSAPASADLLIAIAASPLGAVVLPGLDRDLAEDAWREVGEQHPQGSMKRLLERAGIDRSAVKPWPPVAFSATGRWRRRLIAEALRPPERTADWLDQIALLQAEGRRSGADPIADGLAGLSRVSARTEEEAASVAALLLRETLETPDKSCALVTPDAALARRVSARLRRWGVTADSSAGLSLAGASAAVLAATLVRLVADPLDPVALLVALKHPLTRLGVETGELDRARLAIEKRALRGARPRDWVEIERRLAREDGEGEQALAVASVLQRAVELARAPFGSGAAEAADAARALALGLEALARDSGGATGALWSGQAGEALSELLQGLIHESAALPPVTAPGFAELVESLLAGETLRGGGASHPRLQILGVLEARLVRADRIVLAGLEEGSWPKPPPVDPFLSRPMRAALGLPPPERRLGLSAHDFAQAACAPEVILVNSKRRGGSPAVESRWLWRLETLVRGAGLSVPRRDDILELARTLDAPLAAPPSSLVPASRPAPAPPVAARPRELPVTDVEVWTRDPYAIYAKRVLRLRPMDRPDEPLEARARGIAIHAALERFARSFPHTLPNDPEEQLLEHILNALDEQGLPGHRLASERPQAREIARWWAERERERRDGRAIHVELAGTLTFETEAGPFTLTARADRIEHRGDRGDILDFKTGQPPSAKQVESHFAPQLTLAGAILAEGGFPGLEPVAPGELVYVHVKGRREIGEEKPVSKGAAEALAASALSGLKRKVAHFDRPDTAYRSRVAPQYIRGSGDYDHLARHWEWGVVGEADEGGE